MKKLLPFVFVFTAFFLSAQTATRTFVPDDTFEQALIDRGYDDVLDDYVLTSNIDIITELDISHILGQGVNLDLTGIENFRALKILNCSGNAAFFTLDTSQLSQLEELNVFDSFVTIDTTNNPELRKLITGTSFFGGGGPTLELSQNPKLEELFAGSEVDLSNNPLLMRITFVENSVSTIDVTNNPELQYLSIGHNTRVTELDLSNNPKLIELRTGRTGISTLDLSNNPALERIIGLGLRFLNLRNGNLQVLTELNVAAECVQVDDVDYAEAQTTWDIGAGSYSENCFEGLTFIPDNDFEQALIDRGYDDVLDDYVLTANIDTVTELDINGINSKTELNLTGIEDFTALQLLNCRDNNVLSNLDLGQLVNLEDLNVLSCFFGPDTSNNPELRRLITGFPALGVAPVLDLSNNPKLEVLVGGQVDVSNNPLLKRLGFIRNTARSPINLSNNPELMVLDVGENSGITELDVSNNTKLVELNLAETGISSLDLSKNTMLESVVMGYLGKSLIYLNLKNGNNQALRELSVNATGCIQVDDVAYAEAQTTWTIIGNGFYSEDCTFGGNLTYVPDDNFEQVLIDLGRDDVLDDYVPTANIATMTQLDLENNNISDITGLSDFTNLWRLFIINNPISQIDIDALVKLESLEIINTELQLLNTRNNLNLTSVKLTGNIEIDLSENIKLFGLTLEDLDVATLDFSKHANLRQLQIRRNKTIVDLDLSLNPNLESIDLRENPLLKNLNIRNGNNSALNRLVMHSNINVSCIEVDDVELANIYAFWTKDPQAIYSEDCSAVRTTYVPDDALEQALIDLGYDDVLDDFVLTENLENISELFLFSEYNIADFTGLEDMINLKRLNYSAAEGSNGYVPSLDTSKNTNLEALNLENVKLGSLDLSNNLLLKSLSLSNSDLGALDVSKNLDLEYLVVLGSRLVTFDVSQNTNLTYLIVSQNENLVALNIKNGANENLINESVFLTDNPQLFCIQVDDYFLSSSNLRWEKDAHASFSTDCAATPGDSDSDGVVDTSDICPNTAPNNPVSPQGCSLAQYTDLVVQNISIGVGSEPCAQGPSGYIEIGVLRDAFDLNVAIFQFENKVFEGVINANTPLFLGDLSGPYRICVSSALAPTGTEFGSYCYEAECGPFDNTLRTTVRIQNPDQVYAIAISGSKSYEVDVNGNTYTYDFDSVEKQQIDIPLEVGINAITVTGNLDCNGSDPDGVVQEVDNIDEIILFPTLTEGKFTIANNKRHEISTIAVASLDGKRVELLPIHDNPENIDMDLSGVTNGMYIVRIVHMSGKVNTAKVIIQ